MFKISEIKKDNIFQNKVAIMWLSAQQDPHVLKAQYNVFKNSENTKKLMKGKVVCLQRNGQQIGIITVISNAECHMPIEQCL